MTTWPAELATRMRRHAVWKVLGTTLWTWAFFVGYFHLLRHPAHPPTTMPLTPLDVLLPLVPAAVVPYLSLWIYVGIAPGLQRTFRELLAYGAWAGLLCATGLALFWRWPTRVPPIVYDFGGFPGFALLQGIDAPGNACPSMHVAIALFTAIWVDVQLREIRMPAGWRVANWAWFAAIAWSTMAIRQHVLVDVLAGAALALAFAVPSLAWRPARAARRAGTAMMPGTPGPTFLPPHGFASVENARHEADASPGRGRPTPDTMGTAR